MASTTTRPRNNNLAVASLVLGVGSWVALGPLGAVPAVITGHMARKEMRRSPGEAAGEGMATAGLWLGYANLIVTALVLLLFGAALIAFLAGAFGG
jgi:hypothetical protein